MVSISISGLFYTFEALISLAIAIKLWQSYQKAKNPIHKNFIYLVFFLTLSFLLFGLPSLVAPQSPFILKTAFLIGLALIFIGFAFGIKSFVFIRLKQVSPQVGLVFTLTLGFIIILLEIFHFGQPKFIQGVIMWNVKPVATLLISFLTLLFVIPLSVEFVRSGLEDPGIRNRCLWLAAAFSLTGIGGSMTQLNTTWSILTLGHIIMVFGWISATVAFIFTKQKLT